MTTTSYRVSLDELNDLVDRTNEGRTLWTLSGYRLWRTVTHGAEWYLYLSSYGGISITKRVHEGPHGKREAAFGPFWVMVPTRRRMAAGRLIRAVNDQLAGGLGTA